jgi:hypothetical protein
VGAAFRLRRNLSGVLNWEIAKWWWHTCLLLRHVCPSRLRSFTARSHSCALKWQLIWMGDEIINNLLKNTWTYNTSVTFKTTETCIEYSFLDNLHSACAEISWFRIPEVHWHLLVAIWHLTEWDVGTKQKPGKQKPDCVK